VSNNIRLKGGIIKYQIKKTVKVYKFIKNKLNDKEALQEIKQHLEGYERWQVRMIGVL